MRERFCAILVLGAAAGGRQIYDRERNWIAMAAIGFDNLKYLTTQSEQIKKRIAQFGGKLYLEFGGKRLDDYHAARVLPGFEPDSNCLLYTSRSVLAACLPPPLPYRLCTAV